MHTMPKHIDQSASGLCLDSVWFKFRNARLMRQGQFQPQLLQSYGLIIAKQGDGMITVDLDTHRLHGEAVRFVELGQTIAFDEEKNEPLEIYLLLFDIHWDAQADGEFPLRGEMEVYGDHALHQFCESLLEYSRSKLGTERFKGQSLFMGLLTWILHHTRQAVTEDSRASMDRTLSYLEANFKEVITIEQLARMAKISPKYYVSLFKKTYGKTAMGFIQASR